MNPESLLRISRETEGEALRVTKIFLLLCWIFYSLRHFSLTLGEDGGPSRVSPLLTVECVIAGLAIVSVIFSHPPRLVYL